MPQEPRRPLRHAQGKPNILIFMSDDQGPWAMGCAAAPEIITPTLDRLAADGTRFENFFCASPVCSPARASFLTGRIPSQHGVHDWLKSGNIIAEEGETWCGKDRPIEYLAGLTGFTDVLAAAGYVCGFSGKWHLGASATPQKSHSFWVAHALGGGSYTDYHAFDNSPEMLNKTHYVTDFFSDRAIDFLHEYDAAAGQPFCLSVHYTAPHAPWRQNEQPPDVWSLYDGCEFPSVPLEAPHPWGPWAPTPEQRCQTLQGYCTTITAMDAAIGRVLAKLEQIGQADNTLVIFTSDNGYNMGHHGITGKGNGTFPLNMFEESVKVPFIARWPGQVPAGVVNTDLISHYDVLPTILQCTGADNPVAGETPGKSFADALRGKSGGHETVVVFDEYGPTRMIRDARWKYVHRYPDGPHELYDLQEDPREATNLAADPAAADRIAEMRRGLDRWFAHYVDPERDGTAKPVSGRGQLDLHAFEKRQ